MVIFVKRDFFRKEEFDNCTNHIVEPIGYNIETKEEIYGCLNCGYREYNFKYHNHNQQKEQMGDNGNTMCDTTSVARKSDYVAMSENNQKHTPSADKNIQEEFNKFWKDNWRANGGEINQWAFMFWQNAWIKSKKQTLEEVREKIEEEIENLIRIHPTKISSENDAIIFILKLLKNELLEKLK